MHRGRISQLFPAVLIAVAGCGASAQDSEGGDPNSNPYNGGGKADGASCFSVRAEPLQNADPNLVATGNIPLPALGPTVGGWFHPPRGYTEGGTFTVADERAEWSVAPASVTPQAAMGSLRVAEWNVERGNQLDKAIRLMRRINADVWLLNESDLYGANSGGVVVAREIARALGYSYYTAIEFYEKRDDRRGTSGNAIVSRYPINAGESMSIPIFPSDGGYDWGTSSSEPRCGQRNALSARIEVPDAGGASRSIHFVALHTENKANPKVRVKQFEKVRDTFVVPGEPTVMAGDLNTISPFEGANFRKYLDKRWKELGPANAQFDCSRGDDTNTFTAAAVIGLRIDWMLLQPGSSELLACPLGSYSVVGNDGASDHKPVITRLDLAAPSQL